MEKSELMTEVVTIDSAETKKTSNGSMMTKLKTSAGKTFNVFHTKQDKSETKAFQVLKTLPMTGIGATMELVYSEKEFESEGKMYKTRSVVLIKEPKAEEPKAAPVANDMQVSDIMF